MKLSLTQIGNPPSIVCDYSTSSIVTYYKQSKLSLFDHWDNMFDKQVQYQFCLSGGIDSQFSCYVMRKLGLKFDIVIWEYLWDGITVNSHDVMVAQKYANNFSLPYTIESFDLKEFLNSEECVELALKYRTNSPQIAVHMKLLEIASSRYDSFVLGGDVPVLQYSSKSQTAGTASNMSKGLLVQALLAYYNFGLINNKQVIKDLFRMSDETMFLSVKQNIDVVEKFNVYFDDSEWKKSSNMKYKSYYYQSLGADNLYPMIKSTGFETLKKMLAEETGVYNQFDVQYRYPVEEAFYGTSWGSNLSAKNPGDMQVGKLGQVLKDFKTTVETVKPKNCNLYRLDDF